MVRRQKRRKKAKVRTAGRFGVRYGRKIRKMVASIEEQTRAAHKCPRCGKKSVKRVGTGIWCCSRCGYTFAGGTYIPQTPTGIAVQRAIRREAEGGAGTGMIGGE